MLLLVLRKMLNNKWMGLCLSIGTILAVAMVAGIPIYTEGILQRMLIKDLEAYQISSEEYAGIYSVSGNLYHVSSDKRTTAYQETKEMLESYIGELGIPIQSLFHQVTIDYARGYNQRYRGMEDQPDFKSSTLTIDSVVGGMDKIVITHGRMPSKEVVDGNVYEVIITEEAMLETGLILDETYIMRDDVVKRRPDFEFAIRIVGVFRPLEYSDVFWLKGADQINSSVFMDYDLMYKDFVLGENSMISTVRWIYALDYHSISIGQVNRLAPLLSDQIEYVSKYTLYDISVSFKSIIDAYVTRQKQLNTMLWVVQTPVLIMIAFYLFMVAQLIVDFEGVEISVLRSRGGSRTQVIGVYLLQGVILSILAIIIGPFLGLELCKMLGASNGFLEFVQRASLPVALNPLAYEYSVLALVFSVVMMVIPALAGAHTTIVEQRRKHGRFTDVPLWKKLFLDFILIGVSLYGLYQFKTRSGIMAITGAGALDIPIDPFLFLMSTLFILGCGLLILRFYPLVMRFIFWLGRRFWSPQLYVSFIQVSRSRGQEQFLMIFLIFTLSIGIFSANASRTINANEQDRILYENGTDLVLESVWESDGAWVYMVLNSGPSFDMTDLPSGSDVTYVEPPFEQYENIEGLDNAAKVFERNDVLVNIMGGGSMRAFYQAFQPEPFSKVVWSRNDLLPWHINDILNYMVQTPNAVFVSENFAERGVKVGETLYVSWNDQQMQTQVAGFIKYWPSINPYIYHDDGTTSPCYFIIGNMDYMYSRMAKEPYLVWATRQDGVSSKTIYDSIEEKELQIIGIDDSHQQLIERKNDPLLQGLNGALTLGFIVTMTISAIGFIIYWVLSIKSRVLQFGIFRAMGMKKSNLIFMLFTEQIMISFSAILSGIIIGGITCDLFMPMMSITYSTAQQVPPFRVIMNVIDYNRIYLIVGFMVTVGFTILGILLSRIKISQALKLGED